MSNNNQINDKQLENVSGGIMVDGHSYVKINKKDIEGYEYRCGTCGHLIYNKNMCPKCPRCPRCNAEKDKCKKTGRFYMDFEKCNSSAIDAYRQSQSN